MRTKLLRFTDVEYLTTPKIRRLSAVLEQILLSAANMLMSLIVVYVGGVKALGVYSFIFVCCQLLNGISAALLHRQMTLFISSLELSEQTPIFRKTFFLQLTIHLIIVLFLIPIGYFFLVWSDIDEAYFSLVVAGACYTVVMGIFELFKQYLYIRDIQYLSLCYSVIYVISSIVFLGLLTWFTDSDHIATSAYIAMSGGFLVAIFANAMCRFDLMSPTTQNEVTILRLMGIYAKKGRYSVVGMLVTWVQNQSITPLLLLWYGPLIVGQYSLAKMLITPAAVISAGLSRSALPELTRIFKKDGGAPLGTKIVEYSRLNLMVCGIYIIAVVGIGHFSGLFAHWVPAYEAVQYFLSLTVITLLASTQRFWVTQHYVVSMKFEFLLGLGILTAITTILLMLLFKFVFGNPYLAVSAIIIAEILQIILLLTFRQRVLTQSL